MPNHTDIRLLELKFQNYAHDLVANHLKAEYEYQIEKWKRYINGVCDAQENAYATHKAVLRKIEEERRSNEMLAMFALSFVAGPFLSWVSGAIQYNLYPKYFSKTKIQFDADRMMSVTTDHSKIAAKVFGDLGKEVTGLGVDYAINLAVAGGKAKTDVGAAAAAGMTSFKSQLANALSEEAELRTRAIMGLAISILQDQRYGAAALQRLYKKRHDARRMRLAEQERLGKEMILNDINDFRHKWASEWLYYGNNPAGESLHRMSDKMEREIWGMWLVEQDFKFFDITPAKIIIGKNRIRLHELIVQRLVDLDVVLAQARLVGPMRMPVDKGEMKEQNERLQKNPGHTIPVQREGDIDTKKELEALMGWASKHKPDLLGGQLGGVPRIIGSLDTVHARN